MSKTNILHVIDTLSIGGAEKLLVGTVKGIPHFNHHVVYLCGSNALEKELPADCKVVKLNFRSKLDTVRCVLQLRRYIKKNKIDIVHSHLVMATIIARLACPRKVQLFSTIHSLLGSRCFSPQKRFQRFIEKLTYKKRHHVIAVSNEVYRDYDSCIGIKGNCTVLPNFVENQFFASDYKRMSFNGTFRMVTVGSLKPAKNYPYLVEAFKRLPKGIHLDIYGEGPLREQLERDISKYNLNISLKGANNKVYEVLPKYDLFVMSSVFEGHPVALLEAMASGMPAILSDIPVLRETTDNNAIYFDLKNINDFIEKIKAIAAHQVDLNPFAKWNFERIKDIADKKSYMSALCAIYSDRHKDQYEKEPAATPYPIFRPSLNVEVS
jgi:glycosyltransferase involved in cell wall biosynthesis